jgi:tRNA threonylcarbamoyladenosine biosynthesis protein TsaB
MRILAFDTSSKTASVALLEDDEIIYETLINTGVNHSAVLLPAINQALNQAELKIAEIDLFACTLGPGAFTGLRVGISTLKGLILATDKPAVGVSSLEALVLNVPETTALICPVIDAGRGQVYIACYNYDAAGLISRVGEEMVIDPGKIMCGIERDVIIVGDAGIKYRDIILPENGRQIKITFAEHQYIRASAVGLLGRNKFIRNDLLNPSTFLPFYLRSADAKIGKKLFDN